MRWRRDARRMDATGLPGGTVTLLFTDVEGSTRLLHELGAQDYATALAEHRRRVESAEMAVSHVIEHDQNHKARIVRRPIERRDSAEKVNAHLDVGIQKHDHVDATQTLDTRVARRGETFVSRKITRAATSR